MFRQIPATEFGPVCPFCFIDNDYVTFYGLESDETTVWRTAHCRCCGAEWNEVYNPSFIQVMKEPDRLANGQIRRRMIDGT